MALEKSVIRELGHIAGNQWVTAEKETRVCYSYDATGKSYLPDAVVFPSSESEISRILALASERSFYVIPRGSGSGMTGGSLPVKGGVVLALNRMNRIVQIDPENFYARVEPGVVTARLHEAVETEGLFYPPDPASSAICTIGGNVGECAGGPRAVKYGVTRDYVLGLRAVLPSGSVIKTGVITVKGVAGYDLTRLIVGSEGTLAVVSEITLRLVPKPDKVKTMAVIFDSIEKAAGTVSAIIRERVVPRCIEYMDRAAIDCVKETLGFPISDDTGAMLIIEVDGDTDSVDRQFERLAAFAGKNGSLNVIEADTPEAAAELWRARKALSPALFRLAPDKINEDIVVPISRIPDMVRRIEAIKKETGLFTASFGHAGDGNIHCNIMYDSRNETERQKAKQAVEALFAHTLALGGTITGEHGVGTTKMTYLPGEIGPTEIELMKQIKQVFDPGGILNPGKIF